MQKLAHVEFRCKQPTAVDGCQSNTQADMGGIQCKQPAAVSACRQPTTVNAVSEALLPQNAVPLATTGRGLLVCTCSNLCTCLEAPVGRPPVVAATTTTAAAATAQLPRIACSLWIGMSMCTFGSLFWQGCRSSPLTQGQKSATALWRCCLTPSSAMAIHLLNPFGSACLTACSCPFLTMSVQRYASTSQQFKYWLCHIVPVSLAAPRAIFTLKALMNKHYAHKNIALLLLLLIQARICDMALVLMRYHYRDTSNTNGCECHLLQLCYPTTHLLTSFSGSRLYICKVVLPVSRMLAHFALVHSLLRNQERTNQNV
eukprot:1142671-Pelagomonas_calceolata.AAC.2